MGLFGNQNPFEESLDKVTNELNTDVDWGAIIALCDKVKTTSKGPADFTTLILQKINHKVPHVSMQAITVLDACVNNCGKDFHKEIASQHFTDGLRDIIYNYKVKKVVLRLCYFIKKWAEDFKDDPELSHFVSFYYRHRGEGIQFPDTEDDSATSTKIEPVSSDPNVVSSQQEEDDIAKAIEASLKEEQQKKSLSSSLSGGSYQSSLYPSMLGGSTATQSASNVTSHVTTSSAAVSGSRKLVKALYDFEAAEDNELTFRAGDLITILDDSDANWWRGEGSRGSGLFPSNFVTPDLSVEPEPDFGVAKPEEREPVVTFNEELDIKEVDQNQPVLEVNEDLIDQTLATLQSTDPEQSEVDSPQLKRDEDSCEQMEKLIDRELEALDRKHLEYSMLNEKILESLKLYDTLMNDMPAYVPPQQSYLPMQQHTGIHQPHMMGGYPQGTFPGAVYSPPNQIPPPAAPGPSGVPTMGSTMGYLPNQIPQQNPYNPMYQTNPTNYPINSGVTKPSDPNLPQQGQYASDYAAGGPTIPRQYNGQQPPPLTYSNTTSNMAPYTMTNSTQPHPASPSHFPTNHISSQPLM